MSRNRDSMAGEHQHALTQINAKTSFELPRADCDLRQLTVGHWLDNPSAKQAGRLQS